MQTPTPIVDFIGIFPELYSLDFCRTAIEYFENMSDAGFVYQRQDLENVRRTEKNDQAVFINSEEEIKLNATKTLLAAFQERLWKIAYPRYANEHDIITGAAAHSAFGIKLQKTKVLGGYHSWHFEATSQRTASRLLTFLLYLNDVEEGGETEFLYLPKRVKPKAGTLVLFPAAFTHTHRGNPPLSGDKYVITGWIEFTA